MRPAASSAPSLARSRRPSFRAGAGGGSSHESESASATPQRARSRARGQRSAVSISGGVKGTRLFWIWCVQRRKQVPGPNLVLRVTDQVGSGEDCFKVLLTKEPLRLTDEPPALDDVAGTTRLLEAIAADMGRRPADAWGEASCVIRVVDK